MITDIASPFLEPVAPSLATSIGPLTLSPEAVPQIVGRVAAECYGVVGMAVRGPARERVTQLLPKGRPGRGIIVRNADGAVALDLHVVVAYGLNLAEVAATVRSRVTYEVERLTGLQVGSRGGPLQDVKRTA